MVLYVRRIYQNLIEELLYVNAAGIPYIELLYGVVYMRLSVCLFTSPSEAHFQPLSGPCL